MTIDHRTPPGVPPWLAGRLRVHLQVGGGHLARDIFDGFAHEALRAGRTVLRASWAGHGRPADIDAGLRGVGGQAIYRSTESLHRHDGIPILYVHGDDEDDDAPETLCLYAWPDGLAEVRIQSDDRVALAAMTASPPRLDAVARIAAEHIKRDAPVPRAYVLVEQDTSLSTEPIPRSAEPLQRDNYAPGVLAAFDHVARDMTARTPCGRLALLDGPAGTGKTYLVRGLIAAVPQGLFVLVPADLIPEMARPRFLGALLEVRRSRNRDRPLVVVVEDADNCLVPRQSDNMNAISGLLNATDGIVGAALNLWIVATTNARIKEVDPALLRPGRICRRVPVGPLDADHADRLFRRIHGRPGDFARPATLAEIYAAGREDPGAGGGGAQGSVPAPVEPWHASVGFRPGEDDAR